MMQCTCICMCVYVGTNKHKRSIHILREACPCDHPSTSWRLRIQTHRRITTRAQTQLRTHTQTHTTTCVQTHICMPTYTHRTFGRALRLTTLRCSREAPIRLTSRTLLPRTVRRLQSFTRSRTSGMYCNVRIYVCVCMSVCMYLCTCV